MGLVEAWGSGIKRILNSAKEYGLPEPRFQEFDNMFRVELFRNESTTNQSKIEMVKSVDVYKEDKRFGEDTEKVRRKFGAESE